MRQRRLLNLTARVTETLKVSGPESLTGFGPAFFMPAADFQEADPGLFSMTGGRPQWKPKHRPVSFVTALERNLFAIDANLA